MRKVEDIDVIQLIEEIGESATLRKFLLKPSTICNAISAVSFQTMSCFTNNIVLDIIFLLLGGYSVAKTINNWKLYKDIDYNLVLRLEETDVYRRMSENYFTFVHKVAEFAKQFGLKSSKEVLLFFEVMIQNGYFSETSNHEYRKYNYIYPEVHGTLGSQVMTGSCVCRHMSSLFSDLMYQMNMTGCNVVVKINYEDTLKQFLKKGSKKEFNHAVLGVVEEDKKFIYDPTNMVFAGRTDKKIRGYSKDEIAVGPVKEQEGIFIPAKSSVSLNKLHMDALKAYNKASMAYVDQVEIEKLRAKITMLYIKNFDMFVKFYFEFVTLLQDIAADVKQLMPKTDEELKEWVLKY
ncbi:MAG: hypothetical protein ACI4OP_01020 [Candidatus Coprovivens sp.]